MTNKEFNELLEQRISSIKETLGVKAREYASEDDRLHNFKHAAFINLMTPPEALWGMATKHLVSVIDLIEHRQPLSVEAVNEKVGDLINYLILLEAVFKEKLNEEKSG